MYSTNRLTTLIDSILYRNQEYFDTVELRYSKVALLRFGSVINHAWPNIKRLQVR